MTRSTRDLCQDCWQAANPDQYCPDLNRYGTCAQCGADALITRSRIADEVPFEDCGPVVNADGTPTAFTLAMVRS